MFKAFAIVAMSLIFAYEHFGAAAIAYEWQKFELSNCWICINSSTRIAESAIGDAQILKISMTTMECGGGAHFYS